MRRSGLISLLLLAAAVLLPTGCSTTKPGFQRESAHGRGAGRSTASEREVKAQAAFTAGVMKELSDEPDLALEWFRKSLEFDPAHEALSVDVARRLLTRKEPEKAIQVLKLSAGQPDASGEVFVCLGLAESQLGHFDAAVAAYRKAVARSPKDLGAYGLLAHLLAELKRPQEIVELLDQAGKQTSADPQYWLGLAELTNQQLSRLPDRREALNERAVTALRQAAAIKSDDAALTQRIADRLADLGQTAEAETLYLRLRQRFPSNTFIAARLAEIYLRAGRNKEAEEQLDVIRRENPTNPVAWYYLGLIAFEEKRFDRAEDLFRRATDMRPEFEPAWLDLASAQLSLDHAQSALDTLNKTRARFKSSFRLEFLAGLAAARLEKFDEAVQRFTDAELRAKADQPSVLDHRFYFQLGATLERANNLDKSAEYLQKAIDLQPDYAEALNHLGYLWADKGINLDRAHEMIRKAVDLEPDNEAYLDSLGWVLFKLGRPKEALPWLEKAAKIAEKPDATIEDHLGDVLAALHRWPEARLAWRKSLELERNDVVQKKLERVPK
jgi:tetratricopeptide (TPR) repeat protein